MFVSAETFHNGIVVHTAKAQVVAPNVDSKVVGAAEEEDARAATDCTATGHSKSACDGNVSKTGDAANDCNEVGESLSVCIQKVYSQVNSFLTSVINTDDSSKGTDDIDVEEEDN
eukprot:GHVS01071575.1.p2 GENE.GHVS01071575.1~~GHVS01071575.1.p2  ORF type:complete len:115 (-),score=27.22 GHVS01071575.1:547-891(-)